MTWSKQQDQAIRAVLRWARDKSAPQVFRIFGYAGTGKTTLAKEIARQVGGKVLFAAFTGKAALVLQTKGCQASTIHSLIYKPIEDEETGQYHFKLNPDSVLTSASLLIVDEVSMVGRDLAEDLLSFGIKVLVLGDPAQLPPVKGEGVFIDAKPDVMLTEVHRQARDNPIIRMSMDVREGRRLERGQYGDSAVVGRREIGPERLREIIMASDQLLCGMNKTRLQFNARVRQINGITDEMPVAGDRIVCLRNDHDKGTLNGSIWQARSVDVAHDGKTGKPVITEMRADPLDMPDHPAVDITVPAEFFVGRENELHWRYKRDFDQFTYGYALTVHKGQGSQWDRVVVFDESSVFRDDAAKHLYTAITRAAQAVTVVV